MGNAGRLSRTGLALISTCLLVGSILWLALPARAAATISITPASGPPGTSVTVAGTGFGANEQVRVCWGNVGCSNLGRTSTTASGEFSRSFVIAEDYLPGVNTVGACGPLSGCAQTVFSVIAPVTTIPTTTTTGPATTTTITDAPTTTRATTTTMARTTTTRQTTSTTGAATTTSFGAPTPTHPDQSDVVLPSPTSTPQPDVAPTSTSSIPGSEVLSVLLTPSVPTEPTNYWDAAPLTLERDRSAPPPLVAAPEAHEDQGGLGPTEAILLWLATMGAAAGGMIVYEFRRR